VRGKLGGNMVRKIIWGLIIIVIGLWIWFANLGIIKHGISFGRDWPIIIIIIGIMTLIEGIAWRKRCCK
jgi:hypothetical protein